MGKDLVTRGGGGEKDLGREVRRGPSTHTRGASCSQVGRFRVTPFASRLRNDAFPVAGAFRVTVTAVSVTAILVELLACIMLTGPFSPCY